MSGGNPRIDRAAGIAYWQAPETLEGKHVETYLTRLVADPEYSLGLREVLDLRGVKNCNLTTDCITRMVICQCALQNKLIGNQRAVICESDLVFGFCRMFTLKSGEVPMEMQVFRSAEDAAEWLGIDFENFQALPAEWEGQNGECRV